MSGGVYEADGALELCLLAAASALGGRAEAGGLLAVGALVNGEVGVAEFYGDAPLQLLAVLRGPLARDGLDKRRLTMVDVTDGT